MCQHTQETLLLQAMPIVHSHKEVQNLLAPTEKRYTPTLLKRQWQYYQTYALIVLRF